MKRDTAERASDRAYRLMRQGILEFELAPGSIIAEVETAARLGVSRTPLREAVARLLADGLVVPVGARGMAVAPIEAEDVRQLSELREGLDAQAVRLAAQRRDPARFTELAEHFANLAVLLPGPDGPAEDRRVTYALATSLDEAIDEAAANPHLAAALTRVRMGLARIRRIAQDQPARLAEAAGEHRAIAEAIAWGEPELAANAVRLHLRRSLGYALARIGESIEAEQTAAPRRGSDTDSRKDAR